jgi:hypothetical protein
MSAGADSGLGPWAGIPADDTPNRTQNYGVPRRSRENTPVIGSGSDNVSSIKIAESDSESDDESELAGLLSTPSRGLPSSLGLRVHCSWCGVVMREGDPRRPVSHGLCPICAAKLHAELDAQRIA